ncbi:hypothetical protein D9611_015123 [Ephemerocybe angulata]|uniref:F-box domain-containing protein n=1 Tax=Ephemerocybe angulata TaxID=980116 RepID=A0A8H5EZ02_9AGAR|nr:hypothetical protein D9611_015123 [Tulosesus angulatus]
MPLDVLLEIFSLLEPKDLLNMARSCKDFRRALVKPSMMHVLWRAKRIEAGLQSHPKASQKRNGLLSCSIRSATYVQVADFPENYDVAMTHPHPPRRKPDYWYAWIEDIEEIATIWTPLRNESSLAMLKLSQIATRLSRRGVLPWSTCERYDMSTVDVDGVIEWETPELKTGKGKITDRVWRNLRAKLEPQVVRAAEVRHYELKLDLKLQRMFDLMTAWNMWLESLNLPTSELLKYPKQRDLWYLPAVSALLDAPVDAAIDYLPIVADFSNIARNFIFTKREELRRSVPIANLSEPP